MPTHPSGFPHSFKFGLGFFNSPERNSPILSLFVLNIYHLLLLFLARALVSKTPPIRITGNHESLQKCFSL